jgi:hypothetical protein
LAPRGGDWRRYAYKEGENRPDRGEQQTLPSAWAGGRAWRFLTPDAGIGKEIPLHGRDEKENGEKNRP